MNSKGATPTQVYEDFVLSPKLVQEEHFDTIHLNLQGFKKEQLTVVLTSTGILKISGQRPIGTNKWQRFQKEFPVAENCDRSKISAKFENGILYVKQPKLTTTSSVKKDKELSATLAENTPAAKRKKTTLRDEFSKQDNADIDTPAKEEPKKTSPKTSEQTEAKSLAEKKLTSDESNSSSSSSSSSSESDIESTDDETDDDEDTGITSFMAANLKKPRRVMKMTLVGLLILGISLYVAKERSH
ncbi:inactive protein RESTRICTED TEV MOVEMENT 2-like [Solanum dulcamara]|uniref:inactive protein RESTRICTED TEV MOVEMENT 2-like n=1 Tax=Solanum dulcamara TaxID=45834 RepID=UPI0024857492|nr:inactive protein RESTRICTED TEV MOVEMENT 2-like [Solanum dulcamara]